VAQAMKISMTERHIKTDELGLPYSESMVRKIKSGERHAAKDVAPQIAEALDHYAVLCEIGREATAGFGPVYLSGVDKHRSAGKELGLIELKEAWDHLEEIRTLKPPNQLTSKERDHVRHCLMELLDAGNACYHIFGSFCEQYGFSPLQLSRDHYARLRAMGYVTD